MSELANTNAGRLRELARQRGSLDEDFGQTLWDGATDRAGTARRGMMFLILTLSSMFLLLSSASWIRMNAADWVSPTLPWQLWLSTALLLACSALLELGRRRLRAGQGGRPLLIASAGLAMAFLFSQYWAWGLMNELGYFLAANPANSFFYLMTGLHALHVLAGLLVFGKVLLGLSETPSGDELGLQLCAWYWHFLLAIWLVLFAVLSAS